MLTKIFFISITSLILSLSSRALTIAIDFNDPLQANTTDQFFGYEVETFDVTQYGFVEGDRNSIYNSILNGVINDYHFDLGIALSNPLLLGQQLDIDFVIGDFGSPASNGDAEYYHVQVGDISAGGTPSSSLGVAGGDAVRNNLGMGPSFGLPIGGIFASVFTDNINGLSGVGTALTEGNLAATTNAIVGTLSHEIGHGLSLDHIAKAGSDTPNGLSPLMGTGAIDLPNADRIVDREFAITNSDNSLMSINQLIGAVGTRAIVAVPEPSSTLLILFGILGLCSNRRKK